MVRKSFRYSEDVDPPPPSPPRYMPPGLVKLPPGYYVTSNDTSHPSPPPYKTRTSPPTPPPPSRSFSPPPPPPKIRPSPPPPSDSGSASPESSNQEAPSPESQPPESSSGDTSPSPAPDSDGNSTKNSTSNSNSNSKSMIIGAAVGGSLLLIFMVVLVVCTTEHILKIPPSPGGVRWAVPSPLPPMRQSNDVSTDFSGPYHPPMPPPHPGISIGYNNSSFSYEDLAAATGGFDKANLLGQGGFGYVYKGVLPNGKEVAVKSLKSGSGQGEREFQAEVDIISRVHHRHLVSLVGYWHQSMHQVGS